MLIFCRLLQGGPQVKFVESAPASVPRPTEDEIKLMREGGGGIVKSAQQSIDVVACNYCFVPREFSRKPFLILSLSDIADFLFRSHLTLELISMLRISVS